MHYKILVLDLDGTLTNNKKEITENTLLALKRAQQQGLKIVLASGRPTYGVAPIANQLELDRYGGYILSFNGAEIIDWKTKRVLRKDLLDTRYLPYIYRVARERDFTIATYIDNFVVSEDTGNEYVHKMALHNAMKIRPVDNFLKAIDRPISKCLIVGNAERLALLEKELQAQLTGKINVYRSEPFFLELVPNGIDKANALVTLLYELHIMNEDIVAVGDGFNDLSMIKYAGLGVAMGNAQPIVKEHADYITLSNENDGVVHVIEKFILHTE